MADPSATKEQMPWKPAPDVVGKRFGAWIVLNFAERRKGARNHYYWLCRCDCGAEQVRATSNLKASVATCPHEAHASAVKRRTDAQTARDERMAARVTAATERAERRQAYASARFQGAIRQEQLQPFRGMPAFKTWWEMIRRCTQASHRDYPNYGGRGIVVCDRWLQSFEDFLADMGDRPAGMSIDRINNDGNYEPGNCRWATATEQNRNSRHVVLTLDLAQEILGRTEHGESRTSISKRMGISSNIVYAVATRRAWRDLGPLAA